MDSVHSSLIDIRLRPATDADRPFLKVVYASTRAEELALTRWSAPEKESFIDMQFRAQDQHYRQHYAGTSFDLVLVGGTPAGRLYVARWSQEIRIVDIALLPEYRNRGIGTALLMELLDEGQCSARVVSIHVEIYNPAKRLYERLGFRHAKDVGVYQLMKWWPAPKAEQQELASGVSSTC
ncbi:MAG TPA: GNAT family N-acetyltransferase [Candidatus Competibacteraceae bacterium]|nr:GNAT family N-acetyltransferase [Candidatus Competibacteraceae bacterium]